MIFTAHGLARAMHKHAPRSSSPPAMERDKCRVISFTPNVLCPSSISP